MSTQGVIKSESVYTYNHQSLSNLFGTILQQHLSSEAWQWLSEKTTAILGEKGKANQLNKAFAAVPRKTGKSIVSISQTEEQQIKKARPNFSIENWAVDRLSRVWLLMQVDSSDKTFYLTTIDSLFLAGEMNELVALYSSLPLLAYPAEWEKRCAEGVRSNIGIVLESIICHNPFPAEQLAEAPWNQLVMKAFFTEKPIDQIIGLDERRNRELANILTDYAHERWSAGRTVHPMLWRCVGPFIDEHNIADIKRVFESGSEVEKEAAALACSESNHAAAKDLLYSYPELATSIQSKKLSWEEIAKKI